MKHSLVALVALCLVSTAAAQTTQPAPSAQPAAAQAAPAQSTQPSPEQLLNRMLQPSTAEGQVLQPSNIRAIDKTSGAGAVAPSAPPVTVLREGTYLVDRTGRMIRSADGQQMEFAFDADGQTLRDPPVIILPNLKLMAMENAAAASSRDLHFRITGMVTEYRSRNYVLLDKVVVVPEVTRPLQ
jgi:hypothetical protein